MLERLRAKPAAPATPSPSTSADFADVGRRAPPGGFAVVFVAYNTFFNLADAERPAALPGRRGRGGCAPTGCLVVEAFVPEPTRPTRRRAR